MEKLWFGNTQHAQWVPAPADGQQVRERRVDELRFEKGGRWISRSRASSLRFLFNYPVEDASEYEGIEAFQRFAAGEYGDEFVRFTDVMKRDLNLFTEAWAAPGLAEVGHKAIYDTEPTFSSVTANSYMKPTRKATYQVTSSANALPTGSNSIFTLLIPEGFTVLIGATGSTTGTAVLRTRVIDDGPGNGAVEDVVLQADTDQPELSVAWSGVNAVQVYVTRTSTASSSITLASLVAQVLPGAYAPPWPVDRHYAGAGHTGLAFLDSAAAETYIMQDQHLVGAVIELAEVEAWQ